MSSEAHAVIESLTEAAMIVSATGTVAGSNQAAGRLLGRRIIGHSLFEHAEGDPEGFIAFLQLCMGSTSPLVGALSLRTINGVKHLACRGNRMSLAVGPAVLLRFPRSDKDPFSALTQQIKELNVEIAKRKHVEAVLLESLRERDVLMRELQHRVKNNMQMLAGMLSGAAREATTPEAIAALRDAATRFSAVSSVQQLLYGSDTLETVGSESFVQGLVRSASSLTRAKLAITTQIDPVQLPIEPAIPIALILNELLVNAIKYGRPAEGEQRIAIAFLVTGNQVRLEVHDNGPGFGDNTITRRASGLGLVRALLRQLGGQLDLEIENGARCVATFPLPRRQVSQT